MKIPFVLLCMAFVCSAAGADTLWTYDGNTINYVTGVNPGPIGVNPCNCDVDGSVTLNSAGQVISWNFTDGTHSWTTANSTGVINDAGIFGLGMPPARPFTLWTINLTNTSGVTMLTKDSTGSFLDALDSVGIGVGLPSLEVFADPGKWTETPINTPEPGTVALVCAGLTGLFGLKRKRCTL